VRMPSSPVGLASQSRTTPRTSAAFSSVCAAKAVPTRSTQKARTTSRYHFHRGMDDRIVPSIQLGGAEHQTGDEKRSSVPLDWGTVTWLCMRFLPALLLAALAYAQSWIPQTSNSTASLRGVSAVDRNVVWASGTGGTYLHTTDGGVTRSEEHTSELQSHSFISYAVFCLKKK